MNMLQGKRRRFVSQLIKIDQDYAEWIQGIGIRFRNMQVKAATKVNREMLMFYWTLGKDIVELHADSKWGSKFYAYLSKDLADILPGTKSFSETNLKYMKYFYQLYSQISPQVVDENGTEEISPQLVDELCQVPWDIIVILLINVKINQKKLFFM